LQQTIDDARGELTAHIEDLLNTLSNKFAGISSEIFAKSRFALPWPHYESMHSLAGPHNTHADMGSSGRDVAPAGQP
jgi:hypothetical protein